jgi:hypothetical protein
MNIYPISAGGKVFRFVRLAFFMSIGLMLLACGKEGPFGDTPGPKKPVWQYDHNWLN